MALNPSTDPIRIHLQDIAAARTLTGLDAGPAVRQLLREAIAARRARKVPVTMEECAEAAHAAIERLQEAARRPVAARKGRKPPQDMPPAPDVATMPEEAPDGA